MGRGRGQEGIIFQNGNYKEDGIAFTGVAGREGEVQLAGVWEEVRKGMSVQK
jgi:hypothetical protein